MENLADSQINQKVSSLLNAENDSLKLLYSVLEEENVSITNKDYVQLEEIAARKQQLIARLEQNSKTRMLFIEQLGINPRDSNWTEKLSQLGDDIEAIKSPLKNIQDLTRRCRSLNRTNGLVLNQRRHLATQLMGILRDDGDTETYSNAGITESAHDNRVIGKA